MKRLTFGTGVAICAIALASGVAFAKAGEERTPIEFEALDGDGDGLITRAEMASLRMQHMLRADTDGDGAISLQELESHSAQSSKNRAQKVMSRLDANEDGVLSSDEMTSGKRAERRFDRMDRDDDGSISKAEFETARERMGKHRNRND